MERHVRSRLGLCQLVSLSFAPIGRSFGSFFLLPNLNSIYKYIGTFLVGGGLTISKNKQRWRA